MKFDRIAKVSCLSAIACFSFLLTSHGYSLLQAWDFTTADEGLNPTQVAGTVPGGLTFAVGGNGQVTTGNTLRLSPTSGLNSHIDLTTLPNLGDLTHLRAEFDLAGWSFSSGDRRLSMGFVTSGFLFTANASVRRTAEDTITFRAESGGTAGTSDSSTPTTGAVQDGLTDQRSTPLYVRIDWNVSDSLYSVYFSDVAGDFGDPFFSGRVGSGRVPQLVRIGPLQDQPWDPGNYVDMDGVRLYAIPEPSTYAAIFGGLALVGAFAYRRRKNRI